MGIETVVLLLEQSCLDDLLALKWGELYAGMEKGKFRKSRPNADERLNRLFDIDCEAELLDWMDSVESEKEMNVKTSLKKINNGAEGLLKLMEWASPGQWTSWEARTYLYLDVALDREIANRAEQFGLSVPLNQVLASLIEACHPV